jgi:hypothetical protein
MTTTGIKLQRIGRCSQYPTEQLSLDQAAERLADWHRQGITGIEARNADGTPLTAMQQLVLLRKATEAAQGGTP